MVQLAIINLQFQFRIAFPFDEAGTALLANPIDFGDTAFSN